MLAGFIILEMGFVLVKIIGSFLAGCLGILALIWIFEFVEEDEVIYNHISNAMVNFK